MAFLISLYCSSILLNTFVNYYIDT
uniref:Uncharacterized protein n=1 Tax=Arabidopsis thaliana TaxID=3702 RepID=Q56WP5_ARATH|nr:hypothetical protein [Arabidopsis thaliana]